MTNIQQVAASLTKAENYLRWLRSRTCPVRSHAERYLLELRSAKERIERLENIVLEHNRLASRI